MHSRYDDDVIYLLVTASSLLYAIREVIEYNDDEDLRRHMPGQRHAQRMFDEQERLKREEIKQIRGRYKKPATPAAVNLGREDGHDPGADPDPTGSSEPQAPETGPNPGEKEPRSKPPVAAADE